MNRRHILTACAATAAFIGSFGIALAQDGELYQDSIDPNSAFIRVLAPKAASASIGSVAVNQFTSGLSAYVALKAGTINVSVDDQTVAVNAKQSGFYTVYFADDKTNTLYTDELTNSPAKANVSVYNLTGATNVDVFVPKAKANVVSALAAGKSETVAIKAPLNLDFAIVTGSTQLAATSEVALKRGGAIAILIQEVNGAVNAVAVESATTK